MPSSQMDVDAVVAPQPPAPTLPLPPPPPQRSPPTLPPVQVSPQQQQQQLPPPQHQSPYSPQIHSGPPKPTLPLPSTHSPREPVVHIPSLPHSRRPSLTGLKDAPGHAPVQSPHHVVPITNGHHPPPTNGQYYPPHQDTIMDNLSRVQTVTSYNQASLEAQHRRIEVQGKDIERLEGMVGRLQQEMRGVQEVLESIRAELRHRPAGAASTSSDDTLELFAKNLTNMSAKVQEVEGVKMQVEIMKRKITRLEEVSGGAGVPHSGVSYASPHEGTTHSGGSASGSMHAGSSVPKLTTPVRPDLRPLVGAPYPTHHTPGSTTDLPLTAEPEQTAGGWVSVNSGSKRCYTNGVDGRPDGPAFTPGSPKRPKLATMEPQVNMDPRSHIAYERMETDEEYSRTQSRDSYNGESGATPASYAAAAAVASAGAYPVQPVSADDSWRSSESHRGHERRSSPKRGRGGGRVGRPRKSLPADFEMSTPEWEKPEWSGSPAGPDGYYQPVTPGGTKRGSLVRRGSGGGGNASARAMTVDHDLPRHQHDPYAHTKKTRTKPTRNADGILIRKDGRPDMRSHSSAANLRKVHARKEQERALEHGMPSQPGSLGPTSRHDHGMIDTPSPKDDGSVETNAQDRHAAIMKQMFPHGVDESRDRMNYASRLFPAINNSSAYHSAAEGVKAETHSPGDDDEMDSPDQEGDHEATTRTATASSSSSVTSGDQTPEKRASLPPMRAPEAVRV